MCPCKSMCLIIEGASAAGRNASRGAGLQAQLLKRMASWMAGSITSLLQPSAVCEDMLDGPQTALKSMQPRSLGDARVAAKVCSILWHASRHDKVVAISAAAESLPTYSPKRILP